VGLAGGEEEGEELEALAKATMGGGEAEGREVERASEGVWGSPREIGEMAFINFGTGARAFGSPLPRPACGRVT
jgi:hypothetical protein